MISFLTHKGCNCGASLIAEGSKEEPDGIFGKYKHAGGEISFYARLHCTHCGAVFEISDKKFVGELNEIREKVMAE